MLVKRALKRLLWVTGLEARLRAMRYKKGDSYNNEKFWGEKLAKFGPDSLRGTGHDHWTEEDNQEDYERGKSVVLNLFQQSGVVLSGKDVLEVGCGSGYWTNIFTQLGANLTSVDVTDVLFEELRKRFPRARFYRANVAEALPPGSHDLVTIIDVLQHVVADREFKSALTNARAALKPGGHLLVTVGGRVRTRSGVNIDPWRHIQPY